jgi:PBP superfamily domain
MNKAIASLFLALLVLSACGPATPATTPVTVKVQYSPATQPWLASLSNCAGNNVVDASPRSVRTLDLGQADLAMYIGDTTPVGQHTYQIGTDAVNVLASKQNPIVKLSLAQVQALFSGRIQNWKDVGGPDAALQVWVFSSGEDLQQIFETNGMGGSPVTSLARLATSPAEMVQAVAQDANAIGLLNGRWKAEGLSTLFTVATVPVLVSTAAEPQGAVLQIINCLQK